MYKLTLGKDLLCQKSSNSTCMCMDVVQEKKNDKAAFSGPTTTLVDHHYHHHHYLGCPSVQQINYASIVVTVYNCPYKKTFIRSHNEKLNQAAVASIHPSTYPYLRSN
ncbi:hypothetical protein T10_3489 [Trichinella papuae]|uniref:Uncharacterized protein n=1 Tax=Trichinella papuae TaxID=268474 RepID=A0A0V1MKL2_9BILA|nr:hypothetical protein T10_3489 [Trichinella papuae]